MEYVLVRFLRRRPVLVDGVDRQDVTNETFEVEAGPHVIALVPGDDVTPSTVEVDVYDTTELAPLEVTFTLRARSE